MAAVARALIYKQVHEWPTVVTKRSENSRKPAHHPTQSLVIGCSRCHIRTIWPEVEETSKTWLEPALTVATRAIIVAAVTIAACIMACVCATRLRLRLVC